MSIQINPNNNEIIIYSSRTLLVSTGILSFLIILIGIASIFAYLNDTNGFFISILVTLFSFCIFVLCIKKYRKPEALITINNIGIQSSKTGKLLWDEIAGFKISLPIINDMDVVDVVLKNGTILKLFYFTLPIGDFQLLEILNSYHKNPSEIPSVIKTQKQSNSRVFIATIIALFLLPLGVFILVKFNLLSLLN